MIWYTKALFYLPLTFAGPLIVERNDDGQPSDGILNDAYPDIEFGQSRTNIDSYTKESIQALVQAVNNTNGQFPGGTPNLFFWQSCNGWTGVSQYDFNHGTREFYDEVLKANDGLARYPRGAVETYGVPLINDYNDDAGWAGLMSLTAYEAYGDSVFLDRAKGIWEFISGHGYIDQSVIDAGYLVGTKNPNITLSAECNGKTMEGGVYWLNGGEAVSDPEYLDAKNNPNVNAVSTGNYALLGVELCRITGDMSYCERSYKNAQWLDNHMVSPEGLLWDNYNGTDCKLQDTTWTYNTGLYIAVYAGLGHLTGNATATSLAEKTAIAAMTNDVWNNPQGIIREGEGSPRESDDSIGFKSILIRYLTKAHPWLSDEKVKAAIVQYINIQYWALTTLDSDSPSHPIRYGRNWTGPAYNVSSEHAQLAALDVLNGIQLNPDSAFPNTDDGSSDVAFPKQN